jgi:transcriptional regulator
MKTIRREIIELLQNEPLGVRELSQELHIQEREVYPHLDHIARSAKAMGKKLSVIPARCLDCGFSFQNRKKLTPPGHCPKCKGTHLQRPLYEVM